MKNKILAGIIDNNRYSLIFIILCIAIVYCNSFANQFVMDDVSFIVDWPLVQNLNNFTAFFGPGNQPPTERGVYSPLKTLFHALNYHVFGLHPLGYHLISLIIHILGTVFAYKIIRFISKNNLIAFIAGLVFALHPVNVEAITFLTASIDSLGVVFMFVSFYFYIRSRTFDKDYFWAVIFAILAIFTHELTVSLPFLFLLYDVTLRKDNSDVHKKTARIYAFFVILFVYIILKGYILGTVSRGSYLYHSFYLNVLVMVKAFAKYVLILLFPIKLSANHIISAGIYSVDWQYFDRYAVITQSILDPQVLLSALVIIIVLVFAVRFYKKRPQITFSVFWIFLSLIPVSNIIPTESYFAERYLYPAMLGFAFCSAYFVNMLLGSKPVRENIRFKKAVAWLVVCVLFLYGIRTIFRNSDWRNEIVFAQAQAKAYPQSAVALKNLGVIYLSYGRINEAIGVLQKSLEIKEHYETYFFLSQAYDELRNFKQEIINLKKALLLNPDFPEANVNLAYVYLYLGQRDRARINLKKAIFLFAKEKRLKELNVVKKLYKDNYEQEPQINQ